MLRSKGVQGVALLLCVLLCACRWGTKGPTKVVKTTVAQPQLRCGETTTATADITGVGAGSATVKFTPDGPITAAAKSAGSTPDATDPQKGSADMAITAGKVDETTTGAIAAEVANSGWDPVKANVTVRPCKAGAGWTGGTWTPAKDGTAPSGTYVVEVTPDVPGHSGPWTYEVTASQPPGIRSIDIESSRKLQKTDLKIDKATAFESTPTGQTESATWFASFACLDRTTIKINNDNHNYKAGGKMKLTVHLCSSQDGGTALATTLEVTGPD